jgi:hypothetical protein
MYIDAALQPLGSKKKYPLYYNYLIRINNIEINSFKSNKRFDL